MIYPGTAPTLVPNTRYSWELGTADQHAETASFEIVSPSDAQRIREALDLLTPAPLATLHVLLGDIYERGGLAELADREFAEARDRVTRRP